MRLALLACLAACSFHPGTAAVGSANGSDGGGPSESGAGSDARVDAPVDARRGDAAPGACDMLACGNASGVCMSGTCVITVGAGTSSATCPANMPCEIDCTTGTSCKSSISCAAATSCTIRCMAQNACQGANVTCSSGCKVDCEADYTCWNTHYTCGSGNGCNLECCSGSACGPGNTFSGNDNQNDPGTCP